MEEFDTSGQGAHASWPDRFFARIVDDYLTRTGNRGGQVGSADSFLIDTPGLLELALAAMRTTAAG